MGLLRESRKSGAKYAGSFSAASRFGATAGDVPFAKRMTRDSAGPTAAVTSFLAPPAVPPDCAVTVPFVEYDDSASTRPASVTWVAAAAGWSPCAAVNVAVA